MDLGSVRLDLVCHPQTPGRSVTAVAVAFERRDRHIWLRYMADVPQPAMEFPGPAEPRRTDGLWQTTCFEAFIKPEEQPEYFEFNFAPSSQWAAYAFDSYRAEMRALSLIKPPEIWLEGAASWFAIEVELEVPAFCIGNSLELAFSAVIEETDGTKSYWALRHPPGAPDFHHPDCFALTLEAPPPA